MKKLLVIVVCLLLLLGGLAVAVVYQLTRDTARLESALSSALGREVQIGAISDLSWGRETSLSVNRFSIANPDWAPEPQLLSVQQLHIAVDLFSLLRSGPLIVTRLDVAGLRAALLAPAGQSPSWQLAGDEDNDTASRDDTLQPPVMVQQANVTDARVIYRDVDRALEAVLSGQLDGASGLQLDLSGQSRGHPVTFAGHLSRREGSLLLQGEGRVESWLVSVNGGLADPIAFTGLDLRLALEGDYALPLAQFADSPALPIQLYVQLNGSGSQLDVTRGELRSGDSNALFAGTLGNPGDFRDLYLSLELNSPDIKNLLPKISPNAFAAPLMLGGELTYAEGALQLQRLQARSRSARLTGSLRLPLVNKMQGAAVELRGNGASFASALQPWVAELPAEDAPFEVTLAASWDAPGFTVRTLEAQVGQNRLLTRFSLGGTAQKPVVDGHVQLTGKRAHHVLDLLGVTAAMADDPFMLQAKVATSADGSIALSQLEGQLGRSDISGEGRYVPGSPARLDAALHANKLDLTFLVNALQREAAQADNAPEKPPRALGDNVPLTRTQLADRVIPNTPLSGAWLRGLTGDLALTVDELILAPDVSSTLEFRFNLTDGALVSEKMAWEGNFSTGTANLTLRDASPGLDVNLLLDTQRLPLLWLLSRAPGERIGSSQQASYRAALAGQGDTVRQLASSLDGKLAIRGGGGKMNNRGLSFFYGDLFGEVFAQLNPQVQNSDYTNIECHASVIVIEDGEVAVSPGAVLRTDELDIALGGSVDLNTEALNLVFNTRSRKGVGFSASKAVTPYLKLGGNLAHPRLGVNAKGVVVSGGAAVVTGGLSILAEGLWDRWVGTAANPCDALFEDADETVGALKNLLGRP